MAVLDKTYNLRGYDAMAKSMLGGKELKAYQTERRNKSQMPSAKIGRQMRNEQRNIGRDIKATEKAMSKLDTSSAEYANLECRLDSLKTIKKSMAQKQDIAGSMVYNRYDSRYAAMEAYIYGFKGKAHLDEQRNYRVSLETAYGPVKWHNEGVERFKKNLEAKYDNLFDDIDDGFKNTRVFQELQEEYENALRAYDSDAAKRVAMEIYEKSVNWKKEHAYVPNRFER